MVAFLTIPLYDKPIDSIPDLAESNLGVGGWGTELERIFQQHLQVNPDVDLRRTLSARYEV